MAERRFNDAEVAAILERATTREEQGRQLVPAGSGLTLAQLQDIGREIGIAPDAIAESAELLDDARMSATRRFLGLPLGVERTVRLRHRLSDEEWEQLVVELREVFDVRGVVKQEGSLRQWTNGNLQAFLELKDNAQRLRLRTVKGNARPLMGLGLLAFTGASIGITTAVMTNVSHDVGLMTTLSVIAAGGAGTFVSTVLRLFPWARRRQEQMAEIAARVAELERRRLTDAGSNTASLGSDADSVSNAR